MFGITESDPATFAAAAAVFLVLGLVAGLGPARRAANVDPVIALHRGSRHKIGRRCSRSHESVTFGYRILDQLALERSAMDAEPPGRLRQVPSAIREHPLNMFPLHTRQRRHGVRRVIAAG